MLSLYLPALIVGFLGLWLISCIYNLALWLEAKKENEEPHWRALLVAFLIVIIAILLLIIAAIDHWSIWLMLMVIAPAFVLYRWVEKRRMTRNLKG